AHRAMTEAGFAPEFPPEVLDELRRLGDNPSPAITPQIRDLRSVLWSSIDNLESRDLDQIEFAEAAANGTVRLLIGIADVDALAPEDTAIARHAAQNTVTVYTGVETFSMLPEKLSTDLTSLLQGVDRPVVIVELLVDGEGNVQASEVYRALVRNQARLDYE